jgi:hypothetical protein
MGLMLQNDINLCFPRQMVRVALSTGRAKVEPSSCCGLPVGLGGPLS